MEYSSEELAANAHRFRGSAQSYDLSRPAPPPVLCRMIEQFAAIQTPALVVDLGCGTGLSTRYWSERAHQVIGVEPNLDMLAVARARTTAENTTYRHAHSHQTGLDDRSANVMTCCQSLHWMDPERTIVEVARVLRPGGIWAIADYQLPLIHWELDLAVRRCVALANQKSIELGLEKEQKNWQSDHAARIERSGQFRCVVENGFQAIDNGDAARLQGLIRSLGTVGVSLKACQSETALGLDKLDAISRRVLGGKTVEWFWSYRLVLALK